jgi:NodT family efflux transporter outer membrane factor (OMF) lipoprotein
MTGRTLRVAVAVWAVALSGCALKPPPGPAELRQAATPHAEPPPQWSEPAAAGPVTQDWVATLQDATLTTLIAEALAFNADLRLAAARVDAAAAALRAADAALWPQVNLLARGGGKLSGDASGLQGVGLFATWELDLWGRVRAAARSSELQYDATALDATYARQSVAALVAKGWVLAVEARLQRDLARAMVAASEQLVALNRERLRVGSGTDFDVARAQANLETQRDAARNLDLAFGNALRALEALLGRYPAARVEVATALPDWSGAVPAGVPAELLERRPDVVAAERRVAAAFYRTEEAKAARLPRISLSANFTTLSSELFVLQQRDNPLFSAGASLLQPLFLGGLLQAQVQVRTAEQKAALADYGRVTLRVFGEVESSLAAHLTAEEREALLDRAVQSSARALQLTETRFRVGATDARAVQDQQIALNAARVALLRVQAERRIQRVNVHLALGGGFPASALPVATQ